MIKIRFAILLIFLCFCSQINCLASNVVPKKNISVTINKGSAKLKSLPDVADNINNVKSLCAGLNSKKAITRFGRDEISKLENGTNYLYIYDALYDCVENCSDKVNFTTYQPTEEEFSDIFEIYLFDNPEHFYINPISNKISAAGSKVISFKPKYLFDVSEIPSEKKRFVDEGLRMIRRSGAKIEMSEYEIAKRLHDEIAVSVLYEKDELNMLIHTAYGVIVNNTAVCDGYSKAMQYFLRYFGINSYIVSGRSANFEGEIEEHAWNIVFYDDGAYFLDVTWDDQYNVSSEEDYYPEIYYSYFNVTKADISYDHVLDKVEVGKEEITLPVCNSINLNYYSNDGLKPTALNNTVLYEMAEELLTNKYIRINYDTDDFMDWMFEKVEETEEYPQLSNLYNILDLEGSYNFSYTTLGKEGHFFCTSNESTDVEDYKIEFKKKNDNFVNVSSHPGNYCLRQAFYDNDGSLIETNCYSLNFDMFSTKSIKVENCSEGKPSKTKYFLWRDFCPCGNILEK